MEVGQITSPSIETVLPTVVSFYAGDKYYYDSADRLREDCDRLGLSHDIVELHKSETEDWSDVCRKKIQIYGRMLERHPNGIFWVDVDTRILRFPTFLANATYDFGAFMRGFRSLNEYDASVMARTFHPGFLHFANTERAREFVKYMCKLEENAEVRATDDYFLEEAWRGFTKPIALHVFAKDYVTFDAEKQADRAFFLFGNSGNVKSFKDLVVQHKPRIQAAKNQPSLLRRFAEQALDRGDRAEALLFLRKALQTDKTDKNSAIMFSNVLLRDGRPEESLEALKVYFGTDTKDVRALKGMIEALLVLGRVDFIEKRLRELKKISGDKEDGYIASRRFRLALEKRAAAQKIPKGQRPKLWWMETPYPGNLGDILNPYIVEKLSGLPPRYAPQSEGMLAIGSVIKFARARTKVWGTGTPRMTDKLAPKADYRAVRGPLTRELVLRSGGTCREVYGDAAMLLPQIFHPKVEKKYKVGLIRHYTHKDAPLDVGDVKEIDIMRIGYPQIEAFLTEVLECETIMSTSLHGLIISHAYGIPTRWCTFSKAEKGIPGDNTKFFDHYAALGIPVGGPLDLSDFEKIDSSFAAGCVEKMSRPFDFRPLLAAAPFPLKPQYARMVRLNWRRAVDRLRDMRQAAAEATTKS